uniref:Uncharacterized protein n=1 Tax=Candidatus Kentrum eta TaxID=2126337 RepID=A0A450V306_9GAMM|nr:MAG: hypothetical protein BECKH772A_GA0070896_101555 [Candidatus Kentron sp. H]
MKYKHNIQTHQWLMLSLENRARQVIEISVTVSAMIPLTLRPGFITPVFILRTGHLFNFENSQNARWH